jgi:hypothetical protein
MYRFSILAISGLLAAGCQTSADFEANKDAQLRSLMAAYAGQTIEDFQRKNPNFALVDGYDSPDARTFVFETSPVVVTTTTPAYTPAPRVFNNPSLGTGFNNLNAAINTVPAISRSTVQVCRITFRAKSTGVGSQPSNWQIIEATHQGYC